MPKVCLVTLPARYLTPFILGLAVLQPAHAVLTSYTANGVDLVHSSESNISYTATGNLLAQWAAEGSFAAALTDILALTPKVQVQRGFGSPDERTLDNSDILPTGRVSFFGALAVVNYLNHTRFAGTDTWRLPLADNGKYFTGGNLQGYIRGSELGQLYYDEWGCKSANISSCPSTSPIIDSPRDQTWTRNDRFFDFGGGSTLTIVEPYNFHLGRGDQNFIAPSFSFYLVPVAPGMVSAVPEPQAAWLLLSGLAGLLAWAQRRR